MSKLDKEVSKKQLRDARDKVRSNQLAAISADRKARADAAEFRRRVKKFFGRLCDMTKVTIEHGEARFNHKEKEYYLAYEHWSDPGTGSDAVYMDGDHWVLRRRKPYTGYHEMIATDTETVYADAEKQKDFTAKVIEALADFKKNEAEDGRPRW